MYFTGSSKLVYDRSAIFFGKNVLQGSEYFIRGRSSTTLTRRGKYLDEGRNVNATYADNSKEIHQCWSSNTYSEKATKICPIFHLQFDAKGGRVTKFLWPSQNIWTLLEGVMKELSNFFCRLRTSVLGNVQANGFK